jgi:quercetin dioxygenase-like cupin family protein
MMDTRIDRPDRTGRQLHGLMETFELNQVINWLRDEAEYGNKGHNALTLVKNPTLRLVMISMPRGARLHARRAPGPMTLIMLRGNIRFTLEPHGLNEQSELEEQQMIVLEESRQYEITALQESAFLLTIHLKSYESELAQLEEA